MADLKEQDNLLMVNVNSWAVFPPLKAWVMFHCIGEWTFHWAMRNYMREKGNTTSHFLGYVMRFRHWRCINGRKYLRWWLVRLKKLSWSLTKKLKCSKDFYFSTLTCKLYLGDLGQTCPNTFSSQQVIPLWYWTGHCVGWMRVFT